MPKRAGLFQHGFEGFVVAVLGKDAQAGVSAIQDMVNQSPGIDSHGASHGGMLAATARWAMEKGS